jgi:hypothetical protein
MMLLALLLTGCYLASGEEVETVPLSPNGDGELSVAFVTADGTSLEELLIGEADVSIRLLVSAEVEWGELVIEFLNADDAVGWAVESRYGRPGQGIHYLRSDENGLVRYRLRVHEARNGSYTIRYRVQEPPTPTPTPTPAPTPSPVP